MKQLQDFMVKEAIIAIFDFRFIINTTKHPYSEKIGQIGGGRF